MIIYKVTNKINGKSYIGQTINTLKQRKREHIYASSRNKAGIYFHSAIRKHGPDNFTWEILHDNIDTIEELNKLEVYYIKLHNTFVDGYNLSTGGEAGFYGCHHSKEWKKARSGEGNYMFGKRGKDSPSFGKRHTEETKEKIRLGNKDKFVSEETKQKLSKTRIQLGIAKGKNNPRARKYIVTTLKGEEVWIGCLKEFGNKYNINVSHLYAVASGKRNHSYGYICRYAS